MKGLRRLGIALVTSFVTAGLFAGIAHAASSTQTVQGTTNSSVYRAAQTVTINGTVNGDIFCAGQTVTINATVNGDVLCAAQTINIDGTVNGNVRAVGQTITIGARVSRSVSIAGQSAVIERPAGVGLDLSVAVQSLTVDGTVGRDVFGAGQTIYLNNTTARNVTLWTNDLTMDHGAKIGGNLTYTSPQTLHKKNGTITGTTTYHEYTPSQGGEGSAIFFGLYWLIALIILTVVLVALFPRLFREWTPTWGSGFWWSLLVGFIASFVVPIIILILFVTVIGIPLSLLLLLAWLVVLMLSMPFAAYFTGQLVARKLHPVLVALIGSVILGILELLPIIGWIVCLIAYWLGIGIVLRGLRSRYERPTYGKSLASFVKQ